MPNTCKSNGAAFAEAFGLKQLQLSGGRVSNAWVTYLLVGNNSEKLLLIPHTVMLSHDRIKKDGHSKKLSLKDRPASD